MAENQTKRENTSVPPAILIHESHFLHALCQQDRGELTNAGVGWTDVESLPGLCKRCSNLYALYRVEKMEIAVQKNRL